jgi:hypothetical protein
LAPLSPPLALTAKAPILPAFNDIAGLMAIFNGR